MESPVTYQVLGTLLYRPRPTVCCTIRERSVFMAGGGGGEPKGGGGQKFRDLLSWGGGNFLFSILFWGGDFFNALFLPTFFHESDITCIIPVVGAQQQHKGMFFLNMGGGQIFPTVSWGGRCFSRVFSRGVGGGRFIFRVSILPNHNPPLPLAINNKHFLTP